MQTKTTFCRTVKFTLSRILPVFFLLVFSGGTLLAQKPNICRQEEETEKYYVQNPKARIEAAEFEKKTKLYIENIKRFKAAARYGVGTLYTIPVVFHVFGTDFKGKKVTDSTIVNSLKQVNDDFHGLNDDFNSIDPLFDGRKETMNINFVLAQLDPNGNPTAGINYYPGEKGLGNSSSTYTNRMKRYAWDNEKYMNIYIVLDLYDDGNLGESGKSTFPDQDLNDNNLENIVYNGRFLPGNTDKEYASTLSHEFGHFFNLKHTFSGGCPSATNDGVDDTPEEDEPDMGCRGALNCHDEAINGENYMGYGSTCYKMFTLGQVNRLTAATAHTARFPLWQASNLTATGTGGANFGKRIVYYATTFIESGLNNGNIRNIISLKAVGGVDFAVVTGDMVQGTHYTVANIPAGFSLKIRAIDANNAEIRLEGAATAHSPTNNTTIAITFLNAAIAGGTAGLYNPTNDDIKISYISATEPYENSPNPYCVPDVRYPNYSHITNVKFGTINKTTTRAYYSNYYFSDVATVAKNDTYQLSVTAGGGPSTDDLRIRIWADWNGNNVFETSEIVATKNFSFGTSSAYTYTVPITIPTSAINGKIGLRVREFYVQGTEGDNACDVVDSGETEDYGLVVSLPTCPGNYDNVSNGTFSDAVQIPLNTDIKGKISPSGDKDYYKFTITAGGTITISLSTLPADYELYLYNSSQTQVAKSENGNTTSETINYTASAGTYYIRIHGYSNANNASTCYTLKVAPGTASRNANPAIVINKEKKITAFPNPAGDVLNISLTGYKGTKELKMYDIHGRLVLQKNFSENNTPLNISKFVPGIYLIKIKNNTEDVVLKVIKK